MAGRGGPNPVEVIKTEITFKLQEEFGDNLSGWEEIKRMRQLLKEKINQFPLGGILRIDFYGVTYIEPSFCDEIARLVKRLQKQYKKSKQLRNKFILMCNVPQGLLPIIASTINRNRIALWVQIESTGDWMVIGQKVSLLLWRYLVRVMQKGECTSRAFASEFDEDVKNCSKVLMRLVAFGLIKFDTSTTSKGGKRFIFKKLLDGMSVKCSHWGLRGI